MNICRSAVILTAPLGVVCLELQSGKQPSDSEKQLREFLDDFEELKTNYRQRGVGPEQLIDNVLKVLQKMPELHDNAAVTWLTNDETVALLTEKMTQRSEEHKVETMRDFKLVFGKDLEPLPTPASPQIVGETSLLQLDLDGPQNVEQCNKLTNTKKDYIFTCAQFALRDLGFTDVATPTTEATNVVFGIIAQIIWSVVCLALYIILGPLVWVPLLARTVKFVGKALFYGAKTVFYAGRGFYRGAKFVAYGTAFLAEHGAKYIAEKKRKIGWRFKPRTN